MDSDLKKRLKPILDRSKNVLAVIDSLGARDKYSLLMKILDTEISNDGKGVENILENYDINNVEGSLKSLKTGLSEVSRDSKIEYLNNLLKKYGRWKLSKALDHNNSFREGHTYLWLDLSGFTKIGEKFKTVYGNNDWTGALTENLSNKLTEIIRERKGSPIAYEGDAILNLFEDDEKGVNNAVAAGVELRQKLEYLVDENRLLKEVLSVSAYDKLMKYDRFLAFKKATNFSSDYEDAKSDLSIWKKVVEYTPVKNEIVMRVGITKSPDDPFIWVGRKGVHTDILCAGEARVIAEELEATGVITVGSGAVGSGAVGSGAVGSGAVGSVIEEKVMQISEDVYDVVKDNFEFRDIDGQLFREFEFGKAYIVDGIKNEFNDDGNGNGADVDGILEESKEVLKDLEEVGYRKERFLKLIKEKLSGRLVNSALDIFDSKKGYDDYNNALQKVPEYKLDDMIIHAVERFGKTAGKIYNEPFVENRVVGFLNLKGLNKVYDALGDKSHEFTTQVFDGLTNIVRENSGTVDKYKTNTIFMFNWNIGQTEEAVTAALEMQDYKQELKIILEKYAEKNNLEVDLGLVDSIIVQGGLYEGEVTDVTVGLEGEMLSKTSIGDGVNYAARITFWKKNDGVLVSDDLYEGVEDSFIANRLLIPKGDLKGIEEDREVYKLERKRSKFEINQRKTARIEKEVMYGRKKELEELTDYLVENKGIILIEGKPGYGKSLLHKKAFKTVKAVEGMISAIEISHQRSDVNKAMKSAREFARQYLGIKEGDSYGIIKRTLDEVLEGNDKNYVASLFGIEYEPILLQGDALVEEQAKAIAKLMNNGKMAVLDDVQWMDEKSKLFFEVLYKESGKTQLHLNRKGYNERFDYDHRITLGEFEDEDIKNLVEAELGLKLDDPKNKKYLDSINKWVDNNGTNPYLLKIVSNSLKKGIDLKYSNNPKEIQEIMDEIIIKNALDVSNPKEARIMLMYAAVLGRNFDRRVLDEMGGKEELYSQLVSRGVLDINGNNYSFAQGLTYESFLRSSGEKGSSLLARKHMKAAEAYQKVFLPQGKDTPDSARIQEEYSDPIAWHYLQSDRKKAIDWVHLNGLKSFTKDFDYKWAIIQNFREINLRLEFADEEEERKFQLMEREAEEMIGQAGKTIDDVMNKYEEITMQRLKTNGEWNRKKWKKDSTNYDTEFASGVNFYAANECIQTILSTFSALENYDKAVEYSLLWAEFFKGDFGFQDQTIKGFVESAAGENNILANQKAGIALMNKGKKEYYKGVNSEKTLQNALKYYNQERKLVLERFSAYEKSIGNKLENILITVPEFLNEEDKDIFRRFNNFEKYIETLEGDEKAGLQQAFGWIKTNYLANNINQSCAELYNNLKESKYYSLVAKELTNNFAALGNVYMNLAEIAFKNEEFIKAKKYSIKAKSNILKFEKENSNVNDGTVRENIIQGKENLIQTYMTLINTYDKLGEQDNRYYKLAIGYANKCMELMEQTRILYDIKDKIQEKKSLIEEKIQNI